MAASSFSKKCTYKRWNPTPGQHELSHQLPSFPSAHLSLCHTNISLNNYFTEYTMVFSLKHYISYILINNPYVMRSIKEHIFNLCIYRVEQRLSLPLQPGDLAKLCPPDFPEHQRV